MKEILNINKQQEQQILDAIKWISIYNIDLTKAINKRESDSVKWRLIHIENKIKEIKEIIKLGKV